LEKNRYFKFITIALPVTLFLGTIKVGFGIPQPNELDIAGSQTLKEKMLAIGSQVSNINTKRRS